MDSEAMRKDLLECYQRSSIRGLKQATKWAAELLLSLTKTIESNGLGDDLSADMSDIHNSHSSIEVIHVMTDPMYIMAKSCYDLNEFERTTFLTKNSSVSEIRFLYFYSRYLSAEKKRLDRMSETNCMATDSAVKLFTDLKDELQDLYFTNNDFNLDSYLLYVYAIVLLKLELTWEAKEVLAKSVGLDPLNWCSWHQLSFIIDDKSQLEVLQLPNHWFKKFFLGDIYLELQLNEEALTLYTSLQQSFNSCNYLLSQIAITKHNLRDVDGAIELFKQIRQSDPTRLDTMDIYSNLLYVKEMRTELSSLAHSANDIDPFRVETCCIIANFYSLRGQHPKAVVYFQRALQLNPRHLSAWTLMGHEYMEMKNTGAAIQAYRSAIKCNKRDYRAWYGLGQTYDIMKMHAYSLYYYSVAHCLRPNDSRMMIATGETLEKLERNNDAIKCYWKAGGIGLFRLASLYERLKEDDRAAVAYTDFISRVSNLDINDKQNIIHSSDMAHSYRFLSNYHLNNGDLKLAQLAAHKCSQFAETRDEGKSLLKEIQKKCSQIE
ncbi:cell division cycle protein 23 homolog [Oppia nitens]|uniref:cell division cycle protein 23 homolog n=1 Tax=Oppia nitens TaxID=1686743 RepID=UPI0023DA79CF|nr:cell division cycle protein 23 homolog [Oppia nitens]